MWCSSVRCSTESSKRFRGTLTVKSFCKDTVEVSLPHTQQTEENLIQTPDVQFG